MTSTIPGPRSRALAARLQAAESRNVTYLSETFPVFWERAAGCTVTDVDDNVFLDTTGGFGVAALGHAPPTVVRALQQQSDTLLHGMGDVHPPAVKVELCERLRDAAPIQDGRVILTGGGAEAVEAALKSAAITTGKPGVIAFTGAYHGLSYGALAATHREDFRAPWCAQLGPHVAFAPFSDEPRAAAQALVTFERLLHDGTAAGPVGAVIMEPIQGRAGVRVPPPGFLSEVATRTRNSGALVIVDEIFTGLGRTGTRWATEAEGVTPDLLVCGKALGGGMPIGACVGAPHAMTGWPPSQGEALHTSTFLGHPIVCAAACAALDLLLSPEIAQAVRDRGAQLRAGLHDLADRFAAIVEVRGRGMMLGVRLDSAQRCARVVSTGLQHGLILLGGGVDGDVLTLTPPFTMTEREGGDMVHRLDATLRACAD